MDIISTLFAAYLDFDVDYGNAVADHMVQIGNYNETAVRVEFEGETISYIHLLIILMK